MAETIELTVSDDKANNQKNAKSRQGGLFGDPDGHLRTEKGKLIKWNGDLGSTGKFQVAFYDVSKCTEKGWPFKVTAQKPMPSNMILEIDGTNSPRRLRLEDQAGLWKYTVAVADGGVVTPLDPMIIIRDSGSSLMYYAVPALAFVAGAVFAAMVLRARRFRTR